MLTTPSPSISASDATPRRSLFVLFPDWLDNLNLSEFEARLYRHLLRRCRFAGWADDQNVDLARDLGCTIGHVSRGLRSLKRRCIPGTDTPIVRTRLVAGRRQILLAREGEKCTDAMSARRASRCAPGAHKPMHARGAKGGSQTTCDRPFLPLLDCIDLNHVNVASLPESPPAYAHTCEEPNDVMHPIDEPGVPEPGIPGPALATAGPGADRAELAGAQPSAASPGAPSRPASPSPQIDDYVDPKLRDLSIDDLMSLIDRLSRSRRPGDKFELVAAKMHLESLQAPAGPDLPITPKVPPLDPPRPQPRPGVPSPNGPSAPKPRLATWRDRCRPLMELIGAVRRTAGPAPLAELVAYLVAEFKDPEWEPKYTKFARGLRADQIDPKRVPRAWAMAHSAGVVRPGAIFLAYIEQLK
jgi:hypothetical protein